MAASTVPAAKQYVLNLLLALPALNEVAVTWAVPTEQEDLRDAMVYFDGEVPRRPEWLMRGGTGELDETYTLTLVVKNRVYGDSPGECEAAWWALVAHIETALRADTTFGGLLCSTAAGDGYFDLEFGEQVAAEATPLSDGWFCEGTVPLICHARI